MAGRGYLRGAAVRVSAGPARPIVHLLALRLVPCGNASTGIYETASKRSSRRKTGGSTPMQRRRRRRQGIGSGPIPIRSHRGILDVRNVGGRKGEGRGRILTFQHPRQLQQHGGASMRCVAKLCRSVWQLLRRAIWRITRQHQRETYVPRLAGTPAFLGTR
jgi:hypothetical protein